MEKVLVFAVGAGVEVVFVAEFAQDATSGLVHSHSVMLHLFGGCGVAALFALDVFVFG
jgi:hypothetical protein